MWDNVTSILITLRLAACLNSLRLKHVWSRSVLHTFIVVVEFAPDTEDLQTSWTGHTEKKKKNKKALQISIPRNKVKRLGNGVKKKKTICTVPGWNPAAEGLECGGKSWEVQGGFRRRTPSTSNSLWKTDPASLPPPAPLDPLLLCQPRTDRESPTSLSSTDKHRKRRKSCLASLPVDDVTSWLCLCCASVPVCGCVCGGPINWKSRRAGKGLSKPPLSPPSSPFFPLLSSSHPAGRAASPLVPPKARPSGKGPEKTTPPLKPHI